MRRPTKHRRQKQRETASDILHSLLYTAACQTFRALVSLQPPPPPPQPPLGTSVPANDHPSVIFVPRVNVHGRSMSTRTPLIAFDFATRSRLVTICSTNVATIFPLPLPYIHYAYSLTHWYTKGVPKSVTATQRSCTNVTRTCRASM